MASTINASTSAGLVQTADTSGVLQLQTANTTALTVDASQNVGIGTASPSEKVEVVGNLKLNNGAADGAQLVLSSSGYSDWNIDNYSGSLRTYYGASEKMRLDSSGNLLVGTATQATGALLTVNGSIKGTITSGTAVASTSGTSIDFTGIPSWVKRITVMFNGVSTNGTSIVQIQIGSGSITTSGYSSQVSFAGGVGNYGTATTGFILDTTQTALAATTRSGALILILIGSNTWVVSGTNASPNTTVVCASAGVSPALSGALDRVRITTVNGTDTFDAGSINILYEG